jgi:ribosome-binding protein aMBF1 (putative translation factor)
MKKHVQIYLDYFGYVADDTILCEVCGRRAQDIHHVHCRGMGGSGKKDEISNLMAVCRDCHIKFGDKKQYIEYLTDIHNQHLKNK